LSINFQKDIKMIKTVAELKKALECMPDEKEMVIVHQESRGVLEIIGLDEWEEGITIVAKDYNND